MTKRNRYDIGERAPFFNDSNALVIGKVIRWGVEHRTSEVWYTLVDAIGQTIRDIPEHRVLPPKISYYDDEDLSSEAYPLLRKMVVDLVDENEQLRLERDATNTQLTSIYRTSKENFETSVKTLKSIVEVRSMVEELIVERDKLQADLNQAQGRALSLERELDRMYRRHNGG